MIQLYTGVFCLVFWMLSAVACQERCGDCYRPKDLSPSTHHLHGLFVPNAPMFAHISRLRFASVLYAVGTNTVAEGVCFGSFNDGLQAP